MLEILKLVAASSCHLFAGAAIYISLVEHPARMECGVRIAAEVFAPSYRRAARMQACLAAMSFVAGAAVWFEGSAT